MLNTLDQQLDTTQQNYLGSILTKDSAKPLNQRKCKICKTLFTPVNSFHKVCRTTECAIAVALKARDKVLKINARNVALADKVKREKLKSRSDWLKEAQTAFNAFIRERDKDQSCISCGRHHTGQYHAGHLFSVGARPELRFNEDNVHKQCSACNNYLSGNVILYRQALIAKIGLERVEALSSHHPTCHYTIDDLKALCQAYKSKFKALKQCNS